jgi:hypothetical protein
MPVIFDGNRQGPSPHSEGAVQQPQPGGFIRLLLLAIAGAFIGGAVVALFTLWASTGFKALGAHGFALYALTIGGGFTMALTTGLMVAVFHSDRAGYDEQAHIANPAPSNRDDTNA